MKNESTAPAAAKAVLRAKLRAARLSLSDAEAAAHSMTICERIRRLPEIQMANTVHVYWPLTERREVDTRPLIEALRTRGTRIVLPVVDAFEGVPRLRHVRYEGEHRMRPNRWDIAEPYGTDEVTPDEIDAVVVPAFGAGRNGHRIGHGRGFYDTFLRALDAPAIGAVYARCLVDAVPAEAHDVPLHVIVTEEEVWRVG